MAQKSRNMKALIIGCGAIGGHLAYCLYENGFDVLIIAKKDSYQKIKKEGLRIQINKNKKIIKKAHLKIDNKFKIYKSLKDIKGLNLEVCNNSGKWLEWLFMLVLGLVFGLYQFI